MVDGISNDALAALTDSVKNFAYQLTDLRRDLETMSGNVEGLREDMHKLDEENGAFRQRFEEAFFYRGCSRKNVESLRKDNSEGGRVRLENDLDELWSWMQVLEDNLAVASERLKRSDVRARGAVYTVGDVVQEPLQSAAATSSVPETCSTCATKLKVVSANQCSECNAWSCPNCSYWCMFCPKDRGKYIICTRCKDTGDSLCNMGKKYSCQRQSCLNKLSAGNPPSRGST